MKTKLLRRICGDSIIFIKNNSATILTCAGAVGVVLTSITTAKSAIKAMELISEAEVEKGEELTAKEKIIVSIPAYITPALIGVGSITCILGANILNKQHQAALISAYTLVDTSFKEYKKKVREVYGEDGHFEIVSEISKDKIERGEEILKGYITRIKDKELFYDEFSGRHFESTMEDVLSAEYHFNRNFILRGHADLNEFYEFLGIDPIDCGDVIGWSTYAGEAYYGYKWIDFEHYPSVANSGPTTWIISMPFEPSIEGLSGDFYEDFD